ncbi:FtsX-like permease family protein [Roseivirga sp.]|uniref:FtsX-like permease family protein n=1 Tax=Roseivirga sp. TaxID=1964215 RepID=UPI003B519F54
MLRNYINIALRSLRRQKTHSLINIAGLSVGIMACIIIMLYVKAEASYEAFYPEANRIYRLTSSFTTSGNTEKIAVTPARIRAVSQANFPEVEEMTYIYDWSVGRELLVEYKDKQFIETEVYFADTSYFKVFEHEFIEGNPSTALDNPNAVVMTEQTALKYFGKSNGIVGTTLTINNDESMVTGVIRDFPGKTSLAFDFIMSMGTIGNPPSERWFPMNFFTYVKVANEAAANTYLSKLNHLIEEEVGEEFKTQGIAMAFEIQPIKAMHFDTTKGSDYPEKISANLLYSLVAIAVFILLIACINYINLSTAKSEKRAKEVGVRKVMGAYRSQLIWQFYGETFMVTLLAVVLGVVMAELLLPFFNSMADTTLNIDLLGDQYLIPSLLSIVFLVSLIAGSYPASFLSSFQPSKVLKSSFSQKGGNMFRRVLVTIQFCVSVFLITGTLVIYNQLKYVQHKEVGYDQSQLVYLPLSDGPTRRAYESMKDGFGNITGVESVTASNNLITNVVSGWGSVLEGRPKDAQVSFRGMYGDVDFLETFGMELIAGGSFQNHSDWDTTVYYLMNRTGVESLDMTPEEAIGKRFGLDESMMGTIVGVVEDFHLTSLHKEIEPMAVYTGPQDYKSLMFVRVNMSRIDQVKAGMEEVWSQFVPQRPFDLQFVDESVRALYDKERQLGEIILSFTSLAIAIGCLGLFGLASYLAEKRTKEIGIRKVLGADVSKIVMLLSQEYLKIILVANVIGWPIAYYFMDQWLAAFAYRIDLSWYFFLASGLTTFLVAMLTVSYQSIRAAVSNPIKALRYE